MPPTGQSVSNAYGIGSRSKRYEMAGGSSANPNTSTEVVTAALLVICSKILSGRTKDQNIQ